MLECEDSFYKYHSLYSHILEKEMEIIKEGINIIIRRCEGEVN